MHIKGICVCNECSLCRLTRNLAVCINFSVTAESHCFCKKLFVIAVMVNNGHLVLCERTCFIRANDLRTAESFDSGQLSDESLTLTHGGNSD